MNPAKNSSTNVTLKALFLGAILILINCYWIISAENRVVWELTDFSIFPTVLFTMFSLAAFNLFLKRSFKKRFYLTNTELATIYIMISVATALAGHDIIRQLVPLLGNAFWYATPENEWKELFFQYLPRWLTVDNKLALEGYYEGGNSLGGNSFWQLLYIRAWIVPIAAWSVFVIVLLFVMLCINIIIRKQWIEHEKLSYPITVLPLEIVSNTQNLFSNGLMWIGFGSAFFIELLAGLHFLYPAIPSPSLKYEVGRFFNEKPFNAIGWMPVNIYAFAVGFGYLMPLDLSLSLWVFYLLWKAQLVFFSAVGWTNASNYQGEQKAGAWIGIGILSLWTGRNHIRRGLISVFSSRGAHPLASRASRASTDPLYRVAVFGGILGMAFILFFWSQAGLSYWIALNYFIIYFVLCIAISRMRAELGPPTHELHSMHPDQIMILFAGTKRLGANSLTNTTLLSWLAYGYRCHPMPHQLEGFKIGSNLKLNDKGLVLAMMLAAIVGTVVSIVAHVSLYYKYQFARWGIGEFYRLQSWLTHSSGADLPALEHMGFGFLLTTSLMIMKRHFLWWPFYPVGYAVSNGWAISWMWFSIFLGWLSKRWLLSFGGIKSYRNAMPLFFGFILGQFLMGSLWSIIGILIEKQVYTLFP